MQIVIDIDKEIYKKVKDNYLPIGACYECICAVQNGTPLPKGHGRLIDEKDVIENICETHGCNEVNNNCKSKSDNFCGALDVVEKAPTIIEADKESN